MNNYSNPIISAVVKESNPAQAVMLARFFKTGRGEYGYGDFFLGVKVPVLRRIVKPLWNSVSSNELDDCINSKYHEVRLAALFVLMEIFRHRQNEQAKCINFYLKNIKNVNNWDLVDLSCYNLLGCWLLNKDRQILYDFAGFGRTLWENRIAIVSTMQFIRHNEYYDTLNIAEMLLAHPHDLIHKAIGWLLREVGKHDKTLLDNFLEKFWNKMPRTALRYAIERIPEKERKFWLSRRVCG